MNRNNMYNNKNSNHINSNHKNSKINNNKSIGKNKMSNTKIQSNNNNIYPTITGKTIQHCIIAHGQIHNQVKKINNNKNKQNITLIPNTRQTIPNTQ